MTFCFSSQDEAEMFLTENFLLIEKLVLRHLNFKFQRDARQQIH